MNSSVLHNILAPVMTVIVMAGAASVKAESFSDDNRLYGTWIMESFQYDGEKVVNRQESGYTQIKYYGHDGEYACVEFYRTKPEDGGNIRVNVFPHEYGKPGYMLKNGMYTEMGRAPLKDAIVFTDKDTQRGRWGNRTDIWKRIKLPEKLLRHIVTTARIHQEVNSKEIQDALMNNLMK